MKEKEKKQSAPKSVPKPQDAASVKPRFPVVINFLDLVKVELPNGKSRKLNATELSLLEALSKSKNIKCFREGDELRYA